MAANVLEAVGVPLRADSVLVEDEAIGRSSVPVIDGVYRVYGVAGVAKIAVTRMVARLP
jgi:hypothetical protein